MYFDDCKTLEEIKERYRKLSKALHPDKQDGDLLLMQMVNAEHDKALDRLKMGKSWCPPPNWKKPEEKVKPRPEPILDDENRQKIDSIILWEETYEGYFDTRFVKSLREQLDKGRPLSEKQEACLDNIIMKYKIKE